MAHFHSNNTRACIAALLINIVAGCAVADSSSIGQKTRDTTVAGRFVTTLLKQPDARIDDPSCLSAKQGVTTVSTEFAAMLTTLAAEKLSATFSAQCRSKRFADEQEQSCRLYFNSANRNLEWSVGLSFVGNPASGAIRFETLGCFQTP